MVVHVTGTLQLPLFENRPTLTLTVMQPLMAAAFRLQALLLTYFPWFAGILRSYCIATTLLKRLFMRRFGWQ